MNCSYDFTEPEARCSYKLCSYKKKSVVSYLWFGWMYLYLAELRLSMVMVKIL